MAYKYKYDDWDYEAKRIVQEKLRTDRKMWKLMLFGPLTLGIYNIIFFISLSFDVNKVSKPGQSNLMNYLWVHILAIYTFTILLTFWHYQLASKVATAIEDREISYDFGIDKFWTWYFFGSFIFIGPFIYFHKLCKAMNLLCEDYNKENFEEKGERK